jgi:hypothetical protein
MEHFVGNQICADILTHIKHISELKPCQSSLFILIIVFFDSCYVNSAQEVVCRELFHAILHYYVFNTVYSGLWGMIQIFHPLCASVDF